MRASFAPATILALVLCLFLPGRILAQGTTVVGDGTPASCTAAALATAIDAGGTITFDCGLEPVTIAGGPYTIASAVTIDGGGLVTLSGEDAHRHFVVTAEGSLRLANLTLSGGSAVEGGGSILSEGVLVLDTVVVHDNRTTGVDSGGGAIASLGGALTIFGSHFYANVAAYTGGAILQSDGVTVIEDSVIDGNRAAVFGAIDSTGDLTIRNTMLRGNQATAGDGGAVGIIAGTGRIEDSLIEGNFAGGGGGGVYISPNYPGTTVTIQDTRITQNEADASFAGSLGGGILSGAGLTLARVTVDGNRAYGAGGLFQYGNEGLLTVHDATFHNNTAVNIAGGLWLAGALGHTFTNVTISENTAGDWAGGLYVADLPASLQNVTLSGNRAPLGANVYILRTTVTFASTIIANPQGGGENCAAQDAAQPAISGGYNLDSDSSCELSTVTDLPTADPLLGVLADNGGPTLTHLPQSGSPAIDTAAGACPAADQRGFVRPGGAACDVGAVEVDAAPPPMPVDLALPPLDQPVAVNYVWQGNLNRPVIQYPLSQVVIPGIEDTLLRTKRGIDVSICLYRSDMGGDTNPTRAKYEDIIEYFADGLYEMTNGKHILRYVTITYGCTPSVTGNITGTDTVVSVDSRESYNNQIIWLPRVWPHVTHLSGWGATGSHIYFSDIFSFTTPLNALNNPRNAGYTLAHEWAHYMYGLGDEYRNANTACEGTYSGPCRDDTAVSPSIMTDQSEATGGNYAWLNFSTSAIQTKKNAHYRIYQADGWTVLARPRSQDPQELYRLPYRAGALPRTHFEELAAVAPAKNVSPTIELPVSWVDLPDGMARRVLRIIWRREGQVNGGGGLPMLEPVVTPFQHCLACPERIFGRNEFVYPNPAEFGLQLQRELPIANMQVLAEVKAPDGSQLQAPVLDNGAGGYAVQLPYRMGGQHQVTFTFTNPNLRATFTNAGLHYVPSADGSEPPVIETPVGVPFTVTVTTVYTVTDFQADDHADTAMGATALAADNAPVLGRIDRIDDVDVFTITAGADSSLVVRVVDLTPGMRPRLTIRGEDDAVLFDGVYAENAPYLFAQVDATPGERLVVAITNDSATVDATYQVSAGAALAVQAEQGWSLFLPAVTR